MTAQYHNGSLSCMTGHDRSRCCITAVFLQPSPSIEAGEEGDVCDVTGDIHVREMLLSILLIMLPPILRSSILRPVTWKSIEVRHHQGCPNRLNVSPKRRGKRRLPNYLVQRSEREYKQQSGKYCSRQPPTCKLEWDISGIS